MSRPFISIDPAQRFGQPVPGTHLAKGEYEAIPDPPSKEDS